MTKTMVTAKLRISDSDLEAFNQMVELYTESHLFVEMEGKTSVFEVTCATPSIFYYLGEGVKTRKRILELTNA